MNKRGSFNEQINENISKIAVFVIFLLVLVGFIFGKMNGAGYWEEFYAKEIVKVINMAQPGDSISLNVHYATVIGQRNGVGSFSEMFKFDNSKNELCVKISKSKGHCYQYFNDVEISNIKLNLGVPENELYFEVK